MSKKQTKRTQLKDLAVKEQELTSKEMEQVQGGTSNLNLSKSNINVAPPPTTTTSTTTTSNATASHDTQKNAIQNMR